MGILTGGISSHEYMNLTPRGAYDVAKTYFTNNVVSYDGASYIVLQTVTGITPAAGEYYMLNTAVFPDIVSDFTTGGADKVASAETVKVLDGKITNLATNVDESTDGQILTANGDGTSTFKPLPSSDLIAQIDALSTPVSVAHSENTYTLDMQNQFIKVFDIESADANAKTIALSNVPSTAGKLVQIIIRIKCTTAAAFTHPAGVAFATTPSAFVTGQSYWVSYDSLDGGTTYAGIVVRRK